MENYTFEEHKDIIKNCLVDRNKDYLVDDKKDVVELIDFFSKSDLRNELVNYLFSICMSNYADSYLMSDDEIRRDLDLIKKYIKSDFDNIYLALLKIDAEMLLKRYNAIYDKDSGETELIRHLNAQKKFRFYVLNELLSEIKDHANRLDINSDKNTILYIYVVVSNLSKVLSSYKKRINIHSKKIAAKSTTESQKVSIQRQIEYIMHKYVSLNPLEDDGLIKELYDSLNSLHSYFMDLRHDSKEESSSYLRNRVN